MRQRPAHRRLVARKEPPEASFCQRLPIPVRDLSAINNEMTVRHHDHRRAGATGRPSVGRELPRRGACSARQAPATVFPGARPRRPGYRCSRKPRLGGIKSIAVGVHRLRQPPCFHARASAGAGPDSSGWPGFSTDQDQCATHTAAVAGQTRKRCNRVSSSRQHSGQVVVPVHSSATVSCTNEPTSRSPPTDATALAVAAISGAGKAGNSERLAQRRLRSTPAPGGATGSPAPATPPRGSPRCQPPESARPHPRGWRPHDTLQGSSRRRQRAGRAPRGSEECLQPARAPRQWRRA